MVFKMRWECLTSPDIEMAAKNNLVAILPVGSIETHGPHMPTGTDFLAAYEIAKRAAEREPAVVLPPICYAYVAESSHFPGTIALTAKTLLTMLEEICDEIARNGFKKILIINGHGGNIPLLRVFLREHLAKKKDYTLYGLILPYPGPVHEVIQEIRETERGGHAGEIETSIGLYLFGDLVKMENVKGEAKVGSTNLPREIETPADWPARALQLYIGDPTLASKEKGEKIVEKFIEFLVEVIRKIKRDEHIPSVLDEFYERRTHPSMR